MTNDERMRKFLFLKDWFQNRTDFSYEWNEPYLFWFEGSHSKYYRNAVEGPEPITYRISVFVSTDGIEIEARLYDQSDENNTKVLEKEKNSFNLEFIQEENLIPIIGYVQELDIKFNKYAKDYVVKSKLKTIENDFKK